MKSFLSSAMILLALYAQAASADSNSFFVVNSKLQLNNTNIQTISPTWSLAGTQGSTQLVAFTSINSMSNPDLSNSLSQNHRLGFGLHKQHTPWMFSQVVIKQHPFSANQMQSSIALNIGF